VAAHIGNYFVFVFGPSCILNFNFIFNSVWDMYQEDIEDYAMRRKDIKKKFLDAGESLPRELDSSTTVDVIEEMDPTMKAFLEMEKKLNSK
jgi:hypothetical protein